MLALAPTICRDLVEQNAGWVQSIASLFVACYIVPGYLLRIYVLRTNSRKRPLSNFVLGQPGQSSIVKRKESPTGLQISSRN